MEHPGATPPVDPDASVHTLTYDRSAFLDPLPARGYVRRHRATLLAYLIAACAYIALGVWEPRFLLSWVEGILFSFVAVWAIPAVWRRWRG